MGRVAGLTPSVDPLRLPGAGMPGLALRRLERAAALAAPLRTAGCGVAALTCRRLEALLVPSRGDDALAAALARYGETLADPPPQVDRARPSRPLRVGEAGPSRPDAVLPGGRRRAGRGASPDRGPRAGARGPVAARVRPAAARAAEHPSRGEATAPARPVDPAAVTGLEWLAGRGPGARDAVATPLDLGPRRREAGAAAAAAPTAVDMQAPSPAGRSRAGRRRPVEPAGEPSAPELPQAPASAPGRRPEAGGGRQLADLVRAWNGPAALAGDGGPATPASGAAGIGADAGAGRAGAAEALDGPPADTRFRPAVAPPAAAAVGEEELLGLGDELGRVLVAELRRYGIEVEA